MSEMFDFNISGNEEIDNTLHFVFTYISETIEETLNYIGEKIVADTVKNIDKNKLIYKHNLRDKVAQNVFKEAENMILEVGTNVRYAQYVHNGTLPHWPPVNVMREYVRVKIRPKLNSIEKKNARSRKIKYGDQLQKKINSIAFLISRKIAKEGTKGVPFLRLAFEQNKEWLLNKIINKLQEELND